MSRVEFIPALLNIADDLREQSARALRWSYTIVNARTRLSTLAKALLSASDTIQLLQTPMQNLTSKQVRTISQGVLEGFDDILEHLDALMGNLQPLRNSRSANKVEQGKARWRWLTVRVDVRTLYLELQAATLSLQTLTCASMLKLAANQRTDFGGTYVSWSPRIRSLRTRLRSEYHMLESVLDEKKHRKARRFVSSADHVLNLIAVSDAAEHVLDFAYNELENTSHHSYANSIASREQIQGDEKGNPRLAFRVDHYDSDSSDG